MSYGLMEGSIALEMSKVGKKGDLDYQKWDVPDNNFEIWTLEINSVTLRKTYNPLLDLHVSNSNHFVCKMHYNDY